MTTPTPPMTDDERNEKLSTASREINALAHKLGVKVAGIVSLPEDPEHVSSLVLHDCAIPPVRSITARTISEAAEVILSYANDLWLMTDEEWNSLKEAHIARRCDHTQH